MENKSLIKDEFHFDKFSFLVNAIPKGAQHLLRTFSLSITCFDVNKQIFIFGSNIGMIYGFKRGQRVNSGLFLKKRLVETSIVNIKLISDELVVISTETGVYLINWVKKQLMYGWNGRTDCKITAIQCFVNSKTEKISLVTGDSQGNILSHDFIERSQTVIWKENSHEIVQLEFIDDSNILISSCFRTFILSIHSPKDVIQIGSNKRKVCGKYGAIHLTKSNIIIAARPSLHLIKADSSTGNVIQTFILKNANEPCKRGIFNEFQFLDINPAKLGLLLSFCDGQYYISWNNSSLFLVNSTGELHVKETNLLNLVDVKVTNGKDNEVFLLFNSKDLIRIKRKDESDIEECQNDKSENEKDCDEKDDDSCSIHSTDSFMFGSVFGSINLSSLNFVEDEFKKVFGKIQTNVSQNFNKLSTSIISVVDSVNPNMNSANNLIVNCDNSVIEEMKENQDKGDVLDEPAPLVIHRRAPGLKEKKNSRSGSKASSSLENSDEILVLPNKRKSLSKSLQSISTEGESENKSFEKTNSLTQSFTAASTFETVNENKDNGEQLFNILKAYKQAKGEPMLQSSEDLIENQQNHSDDNHQESIHENETLRLVQSSEKLTISQETNQENQNFAESIDKVECINTNYTWEIALSPAGTESNSNKLVSLCVSGFNCDSGIGLAWFISKSKSDTRLYYYPGFSELKSPKYSVLQVSAAYNQLYVVCQNGYIFQREGIDETKLLGSKWVRIGSKHKFDIKSISVNKHIVWCCDEKGFVRIYKPKRQQWSSVIDDNENLFFKKITVAVNNLAIVWALDEQNQIYVRQGVYYDYGVDEDDMIIGINWFQVDNIKAKDITACEDSVWVLTEDNKLLRRYGIKTPDNYVGDYWETVKGPFLVNDNPIAISGI